jgi:hypothetical protein
VGFDLAIRAGTATLAGSVTVLGLIGIVISQRDRRLSPLNLGAISLAGILGVSLALRTSPWVTGPALVASACLAFLVATDQLRGGVRPWITGLESGMIGSVFALRWSGQLIGRADRPNGFSGVAIIRSMALVTILAATLLALLASGDAVFANVLTTLNVSSGFGHLVGVSVGLGSGLVTAFVTLNDRTAPQTNDYSRRRRVRSARRSPIFQLAATIRRIVSRARHYLSPPAEIWGYNNLQRSLRFWSIEAL